MVNVEKKMFREMCNDWKRLKNTHDPEQLHSKWYGW